MAIFELAIADEHVQRVFNAVCSNYNWVEKVQNPDFDAEQPEDESTNPSMIDNPENQGQFVHRIVRQFLAEHVATYEISAAKKAAAEAADTSIDISDPQVA